MLPRYSHLDIFYINKATINTFFFIKVPPQYQPVKTGFYG